jgi:hypothetical protein
MSNLSSPSTQNRTRREWPNLSFVLSSQNWTSRVWPRPGRHETGSWKYRWGKSCDSPFVLGSCLSSQLIRQQERGDMVPSQRNRRRQERVSWMTIATPWPYWDKDPNFHAIQSRKRVSETGSPVSTNAKRWSTENLLLLSTISLESRFLPAEARMVGLEGK